MISGEGGFASLFLWLARLMKNTGLCRVWRLRADALRRASAVLPLSFPVSGTWRVRCEVHAFGEGRSAFPALGIWGAVRLGILDQNPGTI